MKSNLIYSILGVVFQTLFPLIVYPYITRVLGVSNLGEYNFYASTVSYLALFSGFGLSLYGTKEIGKQKDDKKSYSKVFGDLVSINLLMSVLVYVFIFLLIFLSPSYRNYKLFLITSVTILANAVGAEYLFVALEKQKFMLIRNIIFKVISLILILLFVRDEGDLLIYALIMIVSTAGVSITNIINYRKVIDWNCIKLRKIQLGIYLIPLFQVFIMDVMIHYYGMMDIVILGNMDSVESVGYYSVASKIYALSYAFLASTAVPLLPRAAYYVEQGKMEEYNGLIQKCYDLYLLIITFFSFVLFYYAEDIVVLISGVAFKNSAIPLTFFAPTLLFSSFCNFFIFEVYYPMNKNRFVLRALIISIAINLMFNFALIPLFSYKGSAIAFLISYIYLFFIFVKKGKGLLPRFIGFRDFVREIVGVVGCLIGCCVMRSLPIHFLIQLVICLFLYVVIELALRNKTALYLLHLSVNKLHSIKSGNNKDL